MAATSLTLLPGKVGSMSPPLESKHLCSFLGPGPKSWSSHLPSFGTMALEGLRRQSDCETPYWREYTEWQKGSAGPSLPRALPGTRYGSKDTVNAPDQPHYTSVPRMWRWKDGLSGIKKQWKYGNREWETHKKSLGRCEQRGTRARMEFYLPCRDG